MMNAKALALVTLLSRNSDAAIVGSSLRGLSSTFEESAVNDQPKYTPSKDIFGNIETFDFIDEILPPVLEETKGENMTKPESKGENMTKPEVPPTPHSAPKACDTTEGKLYEHITEIITTPGYVELDTELKKIKYLDIRINQFMDKIKACNITDDESLEALGELIDFKDVMEVEEKVPDCKARKSMKMFEKKRDCLAMDSANVNSEIKNLLSSKVYNSVKTERQRVCYIFRSIQRFSMIIEACEMTGEDMSNSLEELQTHVDVLAAEEGMVASDCESHCPESEVDEETVENNGPEKGPGKGPGQGPGGMGPGQGPGGMGPGQGPGGMGPGQGPGQGPGGMGPGQGPGQGPGGMGPGKGPGQGPGNETKMEIHPTNFEEGTKEQGLLALKNARDQVTDLMGKINDIYDAVAEKFGVP